jgi:AcrR family transcriptional regulator
VSRAATARIEDKRDAILAAALELFAERGFHGTAVPLIAERAKVGAGTLYRYFDSKEAIVNALFREHKQAFSRALLHDFPIEAPTRQAFHEIWARIGRFAKDNPKVIAFLELHHHGDYLDDASRAVEMQMLLPLKAFVEDAQRKQILKPVPAEVLIAIVWGAFVGLVSACNKGFIGFDGPAFDAAEACMWEAIRL